MVGRRSGPEMIDTTQIQESLEVRNYKNLRLMFRKAEPADIAEAFADLQFPDSIILFRLIPSLKKAAVFSRLNHEKQVEMIDKLPEPVLTSILNDMEPDDRTQLLEDLPFEISNKLLLKLEPDERQVAWKLLSFPEGSVGRITNPDFFSLRAEMKVSEALDFLRWNVKEAEPSLDYLFVTDINQVYLGEIKLSTLVLADPTTMKLGDIMSTSYPTLSAFDPTEKAVDFLRKYDRAYFPVLGEKNVCIGVVTADDVFDVAEEEATEDIQQFGGQSTFEGSYFHIPAWQLLRKRIGWLAFIFVGELFTGTVLRKYEGALAKWQFLVFFLPLIVSSGGNSGSQAASLVIRGLAIKEMELSDWWKVLKKELLMGLGLGAILGGLGYARALTWGNTAVVATIVFCSLVGCVLFGAVAGAMLPFLIKFCKFDPAVSSSPLIASVVDVCGIWIFLNIALAIFHFYG